MAKKKVSPPLFYLEKYSKNLPYRKEAAKFVKTQKEQNNTVVIVTGCFDLITHAHIKFLKRAKTIFEEEISGGLEEEAITKEEEKEYKLLVGVESDKRIKFLKGPLRPINNIKQRLEVLDELRCVDFTFVIESKGFEDTLEEFYTRLHKEIRADYLAISEGDPYFAERKREIEAAGGNIIVVSKLEDGSSSSVIYKLFEKYDFIKSDYISSKDIIEYRPPTITQIKLPLKY